MSEPRSASRPVLAIGGYCFRIGYAISVILNVIQHDEVRALRRRWGDHKRINRRPTVNVHRPQTARALRIHSAERDHIR